MAIDEGVWAHVVDLLGDAEEVALACHVDPDGDAIGSMLALRLALEQLGIVTSASWGATDPEGDGSLVVPAQYTFLPGLDGLIPPAEMPAAPPLLIVFDCASPDRLGSLSALVDRGRLPAELDRDMAVCLYVGLVTDTGRFAYSSTTAETMRLGARLIDFGIDHSEINRRVWETTAIDQSDLADLGVTLPETEGLIDVLRAVESAECVLVLKELPDGSWKATMRSKGGVDVGALAERHGGGGHALSAGFMSDASCEDIVRRVVEQLEGQEFAMAASSRSAVGSPRA